MLKNYTTILSEELLFSLIQHISELVVGVEKIVGIYERTDTGELCGVSLKYINHRLQEHDLDLSNVVDQVNQLRQESKSYKWIETNQVPFETSLTNKQRSQLNIFDEFKNLILLIPLPGDDIRKNIILVYFKDEINNFGIQHQKSSLSTENKSIIGHLISASIISYCKMFWTENKKLMQFRDKTRKILEHKRSDNKEGRKIQQYEEMIISYAYEVLEDYCHPNEVNYVYSNDALDFIKSFNGSLSELKKSLIEAIEYVDFIDTNENKTIYLEYINSDTYINTNNSSQSLHMIHKLPIRLQKLHDFLDRLETAALKVDQLGQNIIGNNIGQAMDKSISGAAISEYVGKNKLAINNLFDQFPNQWNFIKNNFKTIINIIPSKNRTADYWNKAT